MKLLHPITAKSGAGPLKIIVIVHGRGDTLFSSGKLALTYLNLVFDGPVRADMICDSALPPKDPQSLDAALKLIRAGGATTVVVSLPTLSVHRQD